MSRQSSGLSSWETETVDGSRDVRYKLHKQKTSLISKAKAQSQSRGGGSQLCSTGNQCMLSACTGGQVFPTTQLDSFGTTEEESVFKEDGNESCGSSRDSFYIQSTGSACTKVDVYDYMRLDSDLDEHHDAPCHSHEQVESQTFSDNESDEFIKGQSQESWESCESQSTTDTCRNEGLHQDHSYYEHIDRAEGQSSDSWESCDTETTTGSLTSLSTVKMGFPSLMNNSIALTWSNTLEDAPQRRGHIQKENPSVLTTIFDSLYDAFANRYLAPEVDYDSAPTQIFLRIVSLNWKSCLKMIHKYPDECSMWVFRENEEGVQKWCMLPLHAAVKKHAPPHIISALLDAYPNAVKETDQNGMTPIEIAFDCFAPNDEVLGLLLSANPSILKNGSHKNKNATLSMTFSSHPPHLYTLLHSRSWQEAERRARNYPEETSVWVVDYSANMSTPSSTLSQSSSHSSMGDVTVTRRALALHAAVSMGAPAPVVSAILSAFRSGVRCVDDEGLSPLQWELKRRSAFGGVRADLILATAMAEEVESGDIISSRLDTKKWCGEHGVVGELIVKEDWDGVLSRLHSHRDEATIMIHVSPQNGERLSPGGCLPLHMALRNQAPLQVIEELLDAHCDAVRQRNENGLYPLEIALCALPLRVDVVNLLITVLLTICEKRAQLVQRISFP